MSSLEENHFRAYFSDLAYELLLQLKDTFEECESTIQACSVFEKEIQGKTSVEHAMIKNWHEHMIPYYKAMVQDPMSSFEPILEDLIQKAAQESVDINIPIPALLMKMGMAQMSNNELEMEKCKKTMCHPAYLLHQLNLLEKWKDPSFCDDSRRYLVCYMLHMNSFAILYNIVPDELFEAAQSQGKDIIGTVQGDPLKALDGQNTQELIKNTYEQMPKQPLIEFMKNMEMFSIAISSLSGAGLEGGNMLMSLLESNGPMAEQLGPMKNMLNMALPLLQNVPPSAFENISQIMQSGQIEEMLNSGNLNMDMSFLQNMLSSGMLQNFAQQMQQQQQQK